MPWNRPRRPWPRFSPNAAEAGAEGYEQRKSGSATKASAKHHDSFPVVPVRPHPGNGVIKKVGKIRLSSLGSSWSRLGLKGNIPEYHALDKGRAEKRYYLAGKIQDYIAFLVPIHTAFPSMNIRNLAGIKPETAHFALAVPFPSAASVFALSSSNIA
jgi:hypothetical protein